MTETHKISEDTYKQFLEKYRDGHGSDMQYVFCARTGRIFGFRGSYNLGDEKVNERTEGTWYWLTSDWCPVYDKHGYVGYNVCGDGVSDPNENGIEYCDADIEIVVGDDEYDHSHRRD